MLRKYPKKNFICILIAITITVTMTGCSLLQPNDSKEDDSDKKKNPPKSLTQMEKSTDRIIQDLEQVRQKRAQQLREQEHPSGESRPAPKPQQQEQRQNLEQKGQEEQQQSQKQEEQQGQQQSQQQEEQQEQPAQQPEPTQEPVPEPDWNKLELNSENLHEQWNNYEPSARTDGAMIETIDNFEKQLNTLTEQIISRNEENTLIAANTLYSYYSAFFKLYAHNQPPEIIELRGLTRQVIQLGQQEKWIETIPLLSQMKEAWQEAKVKMKKPDKILVSKIDAAINDFQYVVTEKKINLARIKGNILIKNLDQVE